MEKEPKEQRAPLLRVAPPERDFPLQLGSCKRLRCVKVREEDYPAKSDWRRRDASRINRRIVTGGDKDFPTLRFRHPARLLSIENQGSRWVTSSPEKEDRCYTTRGSLVPHGCEGVNGAGGGGGVMDERGGALALPRFFISLSNKEKEEDFMAMKGCKLPQRPKKRSKYIQKCILSRNMAARYFSGEIRGEGEERLTKEKKRIEGYEFGEWLRMNQRGRDVPFSLFSVRSSFCCLIW